MGANPPCHCEIVSTTRSGIVRSISGAICSRVANPEGSGSTAEKAQFSAPIWSGRALHFHPRPLLEQGKRSGVIQILVSLLGGHLVNLFDGFKRGQLYARLFRGGQRQVNVLQHEAQRKVRREVALQDE